MTNRVARFTKTDIRRAMAAIQDAKGTWAIEIDLDGKIRLVPSMPIMPESVQSVPPISSRRIML